MTQFNLNDMFKNFGAMKEQMESIRERLANIKIVGEAGAGMVKVTVNGEGQVQSVDIDPALCKPEEKDMMEELIVSALNDATRRARESAAHEMRGLMGGMNIPGLEKMFGL